MKTSVALLIFNRPETTQKVFESIRNVKPPKLFVIADGPRNELPEEAEKCAAARAIVERVDWDCEVLKNYSDINLGCGPRPASGISWVFEQVEEAIVIEDDCLPHPTFFPFCEELLERYRDDTRIMHISGNNFQLGSKLSKFSYYFSRYPHSWGWATWRRAWKYFDFEMKFYPEISDTNWLNNYFNDKKSIEYWENSFKAAYGLDKSHIWDYQWGFACWIQNGLTILPDVNLVSNIGFSAAGTHTRDKCQFANLPAEAMQFPLRHPPWIIRNSQADEFTERSIFSTSLLRRIEAKFRKVLGRN